MPDQYADLARDYHWLISDFRQVGDRHVRALAALLDAAADVRILDCACGTGLLTLALARHGYRVTGTDASPAMVAEARGGAARDGLTVPLSVCAWRDLPAHFDAEFDLVLCGGNSIGHCTDEGDMVAALAAMRAVLSSGGRLILQTRDWEQLLAARVRFTSVGVRERDGRRCVPLYVWSFGAGVADPIVVELVFPIEANGGLTLHSHRITYHPFTLGELTRRLEAAGFVDVQAESDGAGSVQVVARTA